MATNPNPRKLPLTRKLPQPRRSGDAWVATLTQPAETLLWCDECHYWHREVNECAYVGKAGA